MAMTKANKKLFVDALRSGEYKQAIHGVCFAHTTPKGEDVWEFCALGVAADVLCDGEWQPDAVFSAVAATARVSYHLTGCDINDCLESCGLGSFDRSHIVRMNDFERKSFADIADWIEANL